MKRDNRGIALLTKWVFETYTDPDLSEIPPIDDVAGEGSGDRPAPRVDPYIDTIDDPDLHRLYRLWDGDEFAQEADPVGGWIDETQEGMRIELDLFDPDAPSKGRITRSYKLHRMPPLIWL
jgi:hypothetical protein